MKQTNQNKILLSAIVAVILAILCIGLWSLSEAAAANGDSHTFPVYINEILAGNTRFPNAYGQCCDFIELYNSADYAVDIGGFQISDGSKNKRFRFPSDTVMEPKSYLLVYCDASAGNPDYAQFGLTRSGGESIYFLTKKGAVIEKITTVATQINQSMILNTDGSWVLSPSPTPGAANDSSSGGNFSGQAGTSSVCIHEVMTGGFGFSGMGTYGSDWVELYNRADTPVDISGFVLSDSIVSDKYIFPAETVIPANGYLVIPCSAEEGFTFAPFALSRQGGESVVLKSKDGLIVDIMDTVATPEEHSMALSSDGTWTVTEQITPGFSNDEDGWTQYQAQHISGVSDIVISEIMASNKASLACGNGSFCDWIELWNRGTQTVDLSGWYLSDNPANAKKWAFPQVLLAPDSRLVVFCSAEHTGALHADFSLSSDGETILLSAPNGEPADIVSFCATPTDYSVCIDAESGQQSVTEKFTPGFENTAGGYDQFMASLTPKGGLAIWEVMPANDQYLPQVQGKCYGWLELRNISDEEIRLSRFSITDNANHPDLVTLPDQVLAPGETAVIILSGDSSLTTGKYYHASFAPKGNENRIFLFDSDGTLLDYVLLRRIPSQQSFGRLDTGSGFSLLTPTPLAQNRPA